MTTTQKSEWRDLTTEELTAVRVFIERWGRTWRNELSLRWSVGMHAGLARDDGQATTLYCLRNSHGPRWLYSLACRKALAGAERKVES